MKVLIIGDSNLRDSETYLKNDELLKQYRWNNFLIILIIVFFISVNISNNRVSDSPPGRGGGWGPHVLRLIIAAFSKKWGPHPLFRICMFYD